MTDPQNNTSLDTHFEDCLSVVKLAEQVDDFSLTTNTKILFQKYMIICIASNHERMLSAKVVEYASTPPRGNQLIGYLTSNKAVSRQYHSWFNWDSNNANQFFSLFGKPFKSFMEEKVRTNDSLKDNIKAFIKIGKARNELVHGDLAFCSSNYTISEILELHKKAKGFIELFPQVFDDFLLQSDSTTES